MFYLKLNKYKYQLASHNFQVGEDLNYLLSALTLWARGPSLPSQTVRFWRLKTITALK